MTIEELLKPATEEQIKQIKAELTPERIDTIFEQAANDMRLAAEVYVPPVMPS